MYNAVIPNYSSKKDGNGSDDNRIIDADDPNNKKQIEKILFG